MASTYENDLRLEEMATGENSGSWGTKTNTNLELIADAFSYGTETIANADTTITIADGAADAARSLALKINSSEDLTTTRVVTLAPNTTSKVWIIENNTSGGQTLTISAGSGSNITLANGKTKIIATDGIGAGSNVIELTQDIAIADLFVDDDLTVGDDIIMDSDGGILKIGADADLQITHSGSAGTITNATGNLTIDTTASDTDIIFKGTDGAADITALTLDMSEAGAATFNAGVTLSGDLTVDTDTLYVDSANDRVGVNVAAPARAFEVNSGTNDTTIVATSTDAGAFIAFEDSNTTGDTSVRVGAIGDDLRFDAGNGEAMRIDSSQRVLIGATSAFGVGSTVAPELLIASTGSSVGLGVARFATGSSAILSLGSSGGSSVGNYTLLSNGDDVGEIRFAGSDGNDMSSFGARILSQVDGAPGLDDMPGRLVFATTADGASSSTERMRITSDGTVLIGIQSNLESIKLVHAIEDATSYDANAIPIASSGLGIINTETTTAGNKTTGITLFASDGSNSGGRAYVGVVGDGFRDGNLVFGTSSASATVTEKMRILDDGKVLIGTTASNTTLSANPALQVAGTTYDKAMIGAYRYSNDGPTPAHLTLSKSRGTSVNTQTVVQADDYAGSVNFAGSDGTNFVHMATIDSQVDGTPGTNDMPGRLVFSTTADGASTSTERMRITSAGLIGLGSTSPTQEVSVGGNIDLQSLSGGNATLRRIAWRNTNSSGFEVANIQGYTSTNIYEGQIAFQTKDSGGSMNEAMRIDSSQRVLIGTGTARNDFFNTLNTYTPITQVETDGNYDRFWSFVHNSTGNSAGHIIVGKGGGSSENSVNLITDLTELGHISFMGTDGTKMVEGARITGGSSDGKTRAASDMPTRLQLYTTSDGAASVTERMRILPTGTTIIDRSAENVTTATTGAALEVHDGHLVHSLQGSAQGSRTFVKFFQFNNASASGPTSATLTLSGLNGEFYCKITLVGVNPYSGNSSFTYINESVGYSGATGFTVISANRYGAGTAFTFGTATLSGTTISIPVTSSQTSYRFIATAEIISIGIQDDPAFAYS